MNQKIVIVGSGFSSLAASCYLAKDGYDVQILEKNHSLGGRARKFERQGFKFDMGPTWYWIARCIRKLFLPILKSILKIIFTSKS